VPKTGVLYTSSHSPSGCDSATSTGRSLAKEVAFGPRLGATRRVGTAGGDGSGSWRSAWPHRRRRPVCCVRRYAGRSRCRARRVIFALGPAAIMMRQVIRRAFPKSAVKEFERANLPTDRQRGYATSSIRTALPRVGSSQFPSFPHTFLIRGRALYRGASDRSNQRLLLSRQR